MIRISASGGYDQLQYCELPESGYTEGANIKLDGIDASACVVVETHACGVNYADCIIRWGLYSTAKEMVGWPITPGFEFSGTVKKIGANVTGFVVGDKVAGASLFGSYSKTILVPQEQIRKVPNGLSMAEAAGFLCTGITAWYAMFELCKLRKNDSVLIHSAAGGVGSMLVQMAKTKIGCHIVGVVGRSEKVALAKELGCDSVIDKSSQNLWETAADLSVKGYKAIFNANGGESLSEDYKLLSLGGRLVSYGGATLMPRSTVAGTGQIGLMEWLKIGLRYRKTPTFHPLQMTTDNKSLMAFNLSGMFGERELIREALDELFQWIGDGSIKVAKVTEYKLRDVGNAHRDLESGNTVGKLVLITQDPEEESVEGKKEENDDLKPVGEGEEDLKPVVEGEENELLKKS